MLSLNTSPLYISKNGSIVILIHSKNRPPNRQILGLTFGGRFIVWSFFILRLYYTYIIFITVPSASQASQRKLLPRFGLVAHLLCNLPRGSCCYALDQLPICFATSSAKFSLFFSRPSPVSKRTKRLMETGAPTCLDTFSRYFPTVKSLSLTYT